MGSTAHLVAVASPGRGHINPMMNLCKLLASSSDVLITFVVTEEWLGLLPAPAEPNIRLRSVPNVIPSEHVRGLDFEGYAEAVLTKMGDPFERLLDGLEVPVTGILGDAHLPWAVEAGNRRGLPVYLLWMQSALVFTVFYHLDLLVANHHLPAKISERGHECVDYIPGIKSTRLADLHSRCFNERLLNQILDVFSWITKAQCLLLTSFYELEPHVIQTLKAKFPIPIYPIGPSIPYKSVKEKPIRSIFSNNDVDYYYTWLDSQPRSSVLYVSLGSYMPISGPQKEEIAWGLNASGIPYLWIARDNSCQDQIKNNNKGLVVPWCDQLRVLCHPSIGGFLTHCGWNSTVEGVYAGLPMLACPLSLDQFSNSKLIVDDWKVGVRMRRQEEAENFVRGVDIAKLVCMLMDLDGDESKELRKRATDLQIMCHRALEEGGSSFTNLIEFTKNVKGHGH